jgi:predicted acylesterase/phospholipase RssA
MEPRPSVIFQPSKLGNRPAVLSEFDWAVQLHREQAPVGRIYGVSGGSLVAVAFALARAARLDPARWGRAENALDDFSAWLRRAGHWDLHGWNLVPTHGFYNLRPLRRRLVKFIRQYAGRDDVKLSELGVPVYLITMDRGGIFVLYGPPDETLQFDYFFRHKGPPRDATIVDALTAALSTIISTEPYHIDGAWYRDCRPALVDAGGFIADLEAGDPRPLVRRRPQAAVRQWPLNWFTSSFIMHSQGERNHVLLTVYYLDLIGRHRALEKAFAALGADPPPAPTGPELRHVDLPYIGSTEAAANLRQAATEKPRLLAEFHKFLNGQLGGFAFDQPTNVIYGAGGFSGILGGMVTSLAVEAGIAQSSGAIRQIYGVSAGVLNGFFHAVQTAAARHPDLYRPAARHALDDLERFIDGITIPKLLKLNINPVRFWQGWANLEPLEAFILERLAAYTGSAHPDQITFDDIALPLTVVAVRRDGFMDFLGMTQPDRHMRFGGHTWRPLRFPIARSIVAGWSMPTYVQPTHLGDQTYTDGGSTFYDPALFVACLDAELTNVIDVHLDEPEGHHYPFPPRMNLVGVAFDTHNFTFPELRRRIRNLTDLLYAHYRLRTRYAAWHQRLPPPDAPEALPPDFRQDWNPPSP